MNLAHVVIFFSLVYGKRSNVDFKTLALFAEPDQHLSCGQFFLWRAAVRAKTPSRAGGFDRFLSSKKVKATDWCGFAFQGSQHHALMQQTEKPKYDKLRRCIVFGLCMNHFA